MTDRTEDELRIEMARLRQEHHDLDVALAAMVETGRGDALQLQRMKKRKLILKDRMTAIEDQLFPDIIA